MNILVGITGSVAAIKLPELVDAIGKHFIDVHIRVVATESALHFVDVESFTKQHPRIPLLRDADEWSSWQQRGDPVLHIEVSDRLPRVAGTIDATFSMVATQVGGCPDRRSAGCQHAGQGRQRNL